MCVVGVIYLTTITNEKDITLESNIETQQIEQSESPSGKDGFWENVYKVPEGFDLQKVRRENQQRYKKYDSKMGNNSLQKSNTNNASSCNHYANNQFVGEWIEKGPNNNAGSMEAVVFDEDTEYLYAISSDTNQKKGGHLWRGRLDGSSWECMNNKLRLNSEILEIIKFEENNNEITRLFAVTVANSETISYSDNFGKSWTPIIDFSGIDLGSSNSPYLKVYENNTMYLLLKTSTSTSTLYESVDFGYTWNVKLSNLGAKTAITKTHLQDLLYVVDNDNQNAYLITSVSIIGPNSYSGQFDSGGSIYITTNPLSNELYLSREVSKVQTGLYRSSNFGSNWSLVGNYESFEYENTDFNQGYEKYYFHPYNSDLLFFGRIKLHYSTDGGYAWEKYLNSFHPNSNPSYLHSDIMNVKAFEKKDGTKFTIINSHGGTHISYDLHTNPSNPTFSYITNNLNTFQIYDVETSKTNEIILSSQDNGGPFFYQANARNQSLPVDLKVAGGDGIEAFFIDYLGEEYIYAKDQYSACLKRRSDLTGPCIAFYNDDCFDDWFTDFEYKENYPTLSFFYGTRSCDGESGSYLTKATFDDTNPNFHELIKDQLLTFDFNNWSNSYINALETTNFDDYIYIATANGYWAKYNLQTDNGSIEGTTDFLAQNIASVTHIESSKLTSGQIYACGSGWFSPGVFVTDDYGSSFEAVGASSIPNTYFFEVVLDPSENYLYAATESGPYVYSINDDHWYPLFSDTDADFMDNCPNDAFTCVEYLDNSITGGADIVRFGTYGSGLWDFQIHDLNINPNVQNSLSVVNNDYAVNSHEHWYCDKTVVTDVEVLNGASLTIHNQSNINFINGQNAGFVVNNGGRIDIESAIICSITSTNKTDNTTNKEQEETSIPALSSLNIYPNPFSDYTNVEFTISEEKTVSINLYDITGRKVQTVATEENYPQGTHTIQLNAMDLPSGNYICEIRYNDKVETKRISLIR